MPKTGNHGECVERLITQQSLRGIDAKTSGEPACVEDFGGVFASVKKHTTFDDWRSSPFSLCAPLLSGATDLPFREIKTAATTRRGAPQTKSRVPRVERIRTDTGQTAHETPPTLRHGEDLGYRDNPRAISPFRKSARPGRNMNLPFTTPVRRWHTERDKPARRSVPGGGR